jgi:hypothetical protein
VQLGVGLLVGLVFGLFVDFVQRVIGVRIG